jgi:sporulation protein YlmC with PRC-barrel domain
MLYLSQILGRPIFDERGDKIASIKDVIVRYGEKIIRRSLVSSPGIIAVYFLFRTATFSI